MAGIMSRLFSRCAMYVCTVHTSAVCAQFVSFVDKNLLQVMYLDDTPILYELVGYKAAWLYAPLREI